MTAAELGIPGLTEVELVARGGTSDVYRARQPVLDRLVAVKVIRTSWDTDVVRRFADCGVSLLDSPDDTMQLGLFYLGLNPNSRKREDFEAVRAMAQKAREENDRLAARIAELESRLGAAKPESPANPG